MDVATYQRRTRTGPCFICAFLSGEPGFEHETLYDDGVHVAFLNRYPTLYGYTVVAPHRHVEDVVGDLTPDEYLRLQAAVHKVARAVNEVTRPERTYLLSLGSMQGNAHVHWHIAPLRRACPTNSSNTTHSWPKTASWSARRKTPPNSGRESAPR